MRTANRNRNSRNNITSGKNTSGGRKLLALAVATAAAGAGMLPSTASALTYNWTPTAAGTFSWDDVVSNWGGGFPNAAGDIANLNSNLAGAETVNLNTGITVGQLNIGDPTTGFFAFTIAPGTAGALTLDNSGAGATLSTTNAAAGVTNLISAGITLNDNLAANIQNTSHLSISGIIGETGGARTLTKTGTATLTLSGANTFTGGTTINGGIIAANNNAALGTGAVTISNSGSQLQIGNGINLANNMTLNNGGATAQGVVFMNTGTAANTSSTLSGNITIGAAPALGGHFATAGSMAILNVNGNITNTAATPLSIRQGYVKLNGTNTYNGGTLLGTANSSMVQFGKLVSMPATGAVTLTGQNTLAVNVGGAGEWTAAGTGNGTIAGLLAGLGGQAGSTVSLAANTSIGIDTTNAGGTVTYSGGWAPSVTTGLVKLGTGTLELTANGTYNGAGYGGFGLIVRQGTLLISGGTHNSTLESVIGGTFTTATGTAGYDAALNMTGGSLTIGNWFSQGRGNGVGVVSSDVNLSGAATLTATNYSAGFNAATGNFPKGTTTLSGTSSFTVTSAYNFAESAGTNFTMILNDSATHTVNPASGDRSIGTSGTGTMTLNNNSVVNFGQDPILGRNAGGVGTLNINDNATFNAGTTVTKWFQIGYNGQGIVNVNGGNLKVNSGTELNFARGTSAAANSVNQNAGNVTFYSDNGTTVGGAGGINMGRGGAAGTVNTYNLNGGTLTVPSIFTSATTSGTRAFNFNGGTLKPTASNTNFITANAVTVANVRNGGALINTNGFDVTINPSLTHSVIGGDNAIDGGLIKSGAGELLLAGTSTNYTGPTLINGGRLALASGVSLATSDVSVNNGGSIAPGAGNSIVTNAVKSLTLASGSTSYYEFGGGNDQLAAVNTLTVNGGAFGVYQPTVSPYSTPFSTNGTYDLVTFPAGGFSGSLAGLSILPASVVGGKSYTFQLNNVTPSLATALQLVIGTSTSYLWNGSVDTAWNTGANWNGGSFPNAASLTAAFAGANLTGAANTTAVVDAGGKTAGGLTFDNSGGATSFTVAGPGTLTLDNGVSPASITAIAGTHTVSANVALNSILNIATSNTTDSLTLSGNITGSQPINIAGSGTVTLSGANTQTSTTVAGGTLNVNNAGALSTGPVTVSGAITLDNTSAGAVTLTGSSYSLGGDVTFTGTQDLNLGSGSVAMTASRNITVNNKTLTIPGAISGTGASLTKSGNGSLELSGANTYNGATTVNAGTLKVTGSGSISGTRLVIGTVSGAGAAVYQSGSSSITSSNTGGDVNAAFRIGEVAGAAGYYNLSGGTINVGGEFDVGSPQGGSGTFAQFDMSGGTINLPNAGGSYFLVNRENAGGASAVVNFSGGTVQIAGGGTPANSNFNGLAMGISNVSSLISTITFSGSAQFLTPSLSTKLNATNFGASSSAGNISVLNMNGGTLQTLGFNTASNATGGNGSAVINFNGGTIKAGTANSASFLSSVAEAHVFSGGGTIDNNTRNITIGQALLAAAGSGVTSVPVLTGGSGYVTPPQVSFGGGALTNGLLSNTATGYATIDPATGAVTGIVITNPGSYDSTSGLTAFLSGPTNGTAATIDVPVYNAGNVSGGMNFTGTGTTTLTGASTYTGATVINSGTLLLSGTGSVNGSSGVNVNGSGAVFATSSSTAVSAPVTITNGKVDGTGTINSITVASNAANIVTNGLGTSSLLTIGSLTFSGNGALTANVSAPTTVGILSTGGISSAGAATVTVNATNTSWSNGTTYDLVGYGTGLTGGGFGSYTLGSVTGLTSRQSATLINDIVNSALAISITGDSPKWTGLDNGQWVVGATGANKNWKLITAGTATDYIEGDVVLFDDSSAGTTAVQIDTATVLPTTTTFNNSSLNYSVSSTGAFGIGGTGTLTKSGTGALSLNTANTYTGGTTLNAGTLNVNNNAALGTGSITINGGSLDNTSGSAKTLAANAAQTWNSDITFIGSNNLDMGTGNVTLGGTPGTRTVTVNAGTFATGGLGYANGWSLTKAGAGTWKMNPSGITRITGPLAVNAGTLQIGQFDFESGFDDTATPGASLGTGGLTGAGTIENGSGTTRWVYLSMNSDSTFAGTLQDGSGGGRLGLFKAGTGTLTLSGTSSIGDTVTVSNGTLALNATANVTFGTGTNGPVNIGTVSGQTGTLDINGATVVSNKTNAPDFNIGNTAGATGVMNVNSGSVTAASEIWVSSAASATGTLNVSGGSVTTGSWLAVGRGGAAGTMNVTGGTVTVNNFPLTLASFAGNVGNVNVSGGTVTANNALFVGESGTGTLTVSGTGDVVVNGTTGLGIGTLTGGTGIVDLNGGTITAPKVYSAVSGSNSAFDFNGGTLRANASSTTFMQGLTAAYIRDNGATIDTNGNDITVAQVLQHSAFGGDAAIDGGLTKTGAGTMTLSSAPTYTGQTSATAGKLITSVAIQNNAPMTAATGGTIQVALNGGATGVTYVSSATASTGKIDLRDNDMVVEYGAGPSSYTSILNQVKAGLALLGGTDADFDGIGDAGIGSTEVDLQTIAGTVLAVVDDGDPNIGGGITSISGYTIVNPAQSVLVKYTWFGDANLDGVVDGSDYALTDTGFTSGGALTGWVFGDMNFDGLVTGEDYALVDTGFIAQTGALPEPTTLGLLGLGAMGMLRRRRKA